MSTTVVNVRESDCDLYVGRGGWGKGGKRYGRSVWANPYRVGRPFSSSRPREYEQPYVGKVLSREDAIALYRLYIVERVDLLASLGELRGRMLGCHCKPLACHADVLVELVEVNHG